MNCKTLKKISVDYLYGELDGKQYVLAEKHLQECPECRQYLTQMGAALASVERLPSAEPSRMAFDNVMRAARKAVQQPKRKAYHLPAWIFHPAVAIVLISLFVGGTIGLQRFINVRNFPEQSLEMEAKTDEIQETDMEDFTAEKPLRAQTKNEERGVGTMARRRSSAPAASSDRNSLESAPQRMSMDSAPVELGLEQVAPDFKSKSLPGTIQPHALEEEFQMDSSTINEIYGDGVQLYNRGDHRNAILKFSQVIAASPEYKNQDGEADIYMLRGLSYRILNQPAKAAEDFQKSAELFRIE